MTEERADIHRKLVLELKEGSHKAFNALYDCYADLLYGFVFNLTKSSQLSEDILQETFLRLWQVHEQINLSKSFKSYLYTIAKNLVMDSFRKQVNNVVFEEYICSEEFQHAVASDVERQIDFDEFQKKYIELKSKLPIRQRTIFELSRDEECSIDEIAQKLAISPQTVKNQLTLALKKLRSGLVGIDGAIILLLLLHQ